MSVARRTSRSCRSCSAGTPTRTSEPRGRAARPGRPRPGAVPRPLPARALRRAAAAGRRGPRPGGRPAGDPDGRAVRRGRPDHPPAPPGRAAQHPARAAQDHRLRHPRHRRGDQARRPHRDPARGRGDRPVRHPREHPRRARPTTSSATSSGSGSTLKQLSLARVSEIAARGAADRDASGSGWPTSSPAPSAPGTTRSSCSTTAAARQGWPWLRQLRGETVPAFDHEQLDSLDSRATLNDALDTMLTSSHGARRRHRGPRPVPRRHRLRRRHRPHPAAAGGERRRGRTRRRGPWPTDDA